MASSSSLSSSLSVTVAVAVVLVALATTACKAASNCTSQTFNNKTFSSCTDLPHLKASLFWTYHPTNSTASIAFLAPPPKPTGWIAWAINPTSTGMLGCQSLIAFQSANGSINLQTYNVSAYGPVHPSPISINASGLEAAFQGGAMRIFATVELPKNSTKLNQVWQVGSSVTAGLPDQHAFSKENLLAMAEWDLLKGEAVVGKSSGKVGGGENSTTVAAAPTPSSSSSTPAAASSTPSVSPPSLISGSSRSWKVLMVLVFAFEHFWIV
ncbi:hypothetical protein ACLOJK_009540 [Asimina triloba]